MNEPTRGPEEQAPGTQPAPPPPPPVGAPGQGSPAEGRPGPANDTSKILAALGYPIWIIALIAILIEPYKNEPFVKQHAMQALALGLAVFVLNFVLGMTGVLSFLTPLIWLAALVYQIILALKAWNGEYVEIPVITEQLKKQFG